MFASRRGSWRIWLVVGLGLCGYGYYEWSKLHVPSDAELTQAIEVQYQSDIARLQQHAGEAPVDITPEWRDKFRAAIRNEQLAPIESTKRRIQSMVGLGLLLVVMSAGMFVATYLSEKQARESKAGRP